MNKFKELKNKPALKILTNRYVLIFLVFLIWMLFFDENSYLYHRKYNQEIDELKSSIEFYENEISKNTKMIKALENDEKTEKFARETYQMKKENEVLFLIDFDTLK